jgi:hypothetical protein
MYDPYLKRFHGLSNQYKSETRCMLNVFTTTKRFSQFLLVGIPCDKIAIMIEIHKNKISQRKLNGQLFP